MSHIFPILEANEVFLPNIQFTLKYVLRGPYTEQVTVLGLQNKSAMVSALGMLWVLTILG